MKILYIVSTLKRSGPTNQLYSLTKHLIKVDHDISILTLSSEPEDSRWDDFQEMGINLFSLGLNRVDSIFTGKKRVNSFIKEKGNFDVIHTQGIRADSLLSKIKGNFKWFITSHNNPDKDYPLKFGLIKGSLMAWRHKNVLKSCQRVISCSKTIQSELQDKGIKSHAIQNGVELDEIDHFEPLALQEFERPIFISVGSLIDRKNMGAIVQVYNEYSNSNKGSLIIVGDGPQKVELEENANNKITFTGNIDNVPSYLKGSDFFISASKAEGLPYTVLEALAADLPVILSDIPSHKEINVECGGNCILFDLGNAKDELLKVLKGLKPGLNKYDGSRKVAEAVFSAKSMALKYNEYYLK